MKRLLPLVLLVACGDGDLDVEGFLAPNASEAADAVWVLGGPERSPILGDTFRIRGLPGETLDLRFTREGREVGRMVVAEAGRGGRLALEEVWFGDGLAFPARVRRTGGPLPVVNGVRMGGDDDLPDRISVDATVLAASSDLLLIRPTSGALADLRVVTAAATTRRTEDGDPADLSRLEFGDTIRVEATRQGAVFVAAAVTVPRRVASRSGRANEASEAAADAGPTAAGRTPAPARASDPSRPPRPSTAGPPAGRGRNPDPPGRGGGRDRNRGRGS